VTIIREVIGEKVMMTIL